jgi:Flp pilus assembly protein TadD
VVAAVLLLSWQRDEDSCGEASEVLVAAQGPEDPPPRVELDDAVAQIRRTCEPEGLRRAAALLVAGGDERAVSLARMATNSEPRNFRAWVTLSTALEAGDPAAAERARRRAVELNPRLAGPPAP